MGLLPVLFGADLNDIEHDYKRNGTTTLFAALNVLDGEVVAQCQQRHRHIKWLKFLGRIDRETPKDKILHLIADDYATPATNSVRMSVLPSGAKGNGAYLSPKALKSRA